MYWVYCDKGGHIGRIVMYWMFCDKGGHRMTHWTYCERCIVSIPVERRMNVSNHVLDMCLKI
jgi:hypothetical protein